MISLVKCCRDERLEIAYVVYSEEVGSQPCGQVILYSNLLSSQEMCHSYCVLRFTVMSISKQETDGSAVMLEMDIGPRCWFRLAGRFHMSITNIALWCGRTSYTNRNSRDTALW